jgi:IS605 OrfB family transposase
LQREDLKQKKVLQNVSIYARLDKNQFKIVDTLCFLSKNLYNVGLYNERQHYHAIQLAKPDLDKLRPDIIGNLFELTDFYIPFTRSKDHPQKDFCNYRLSEVNENYKLLYSDTANQTLKDVEEGYRSFFGLLDLKLKGKYNKPINTPKYLPKNGRHKVSYPRVRVNGNKVTLGLSKVFKKQYGCNGKELTFQIPSSIKPHQIREVTLLPIHNGKCYKISFSYEIKKLPEVKLDNTKYLGIDLGVNNFATILDNATGTATLIDGKYLKSLNRWYNKENAKLQSIKDKQSISGITNRQHRMLVKRDNQINEAMNRYVDFIIKYAVEYQIGNIVCLRWDGIKQNRKAQKKDNQNFIQIPYDKFRRKLDGKCKLYGIKYHGEDSEAYTSRTDALALDDIKEQEYGKSRRIKRGLYKSITGHLFNADVNAAMNHIRKVAGDAPIQEIVSRGLFNRPVRIRLAFEQANFSKQQQPVFSLATTSCCNPPALAGGY